MSKLKFKYCLNGVEQLNYGKGIPFFEDEILTKYKDYINRIIDENGYAIIDFVKGEYYRSIRGVSSELQSILDKLD